MFFWKRDRELLMEISEKLDVLIERVEALEKIDPKPIVTATVKSSQAAYNGIKSSLDNMYNSLKKDMAEVKATVGSKYVGSNDIAEENDGEENV